MERVGEIDLTSVGWLSKRPLQSVLGQAKQEPGAPAWFPTRMARAQVFGP